MSSQDASLITHLESVLARSKRPALCHSVIPTLVNSINSIAAKLRSASNVAAVGSSNNFGDEQLNVDVLAEETLRSRIVACDSIVTASSEEDPEERRVHADDRGKKPANGEEYTIAFDPLDGSSIIAPNWTVGTIIGIWDGASALGSKPVEKQIASILGIYGPRTTVIIAVRLPGAAATCFELGLGEADGVSTIEIVRPAIRLHTPPFATRYFAPANLRCAAEDELYFALVTHFIREKYTLRYSGGLVPDVTHALVKGHGIYLSPVTTRSKAKLRRLYELAPIALIVECAGGKAIDPADGQDILSKAIGSPSETAGLICGTAEEVLFARGALVR